MTPDAGIDEPVYSDVSFKILDFQSYYNKNPNWTLNEQLFGKGAGCDFHFETCLTKVTVNAATPAVQPTMDKFFCNSSSEE
jgi:hypothetical protein